MTDTDFCRSCRTAGGTSPLTVQLSPEQILSATIKSDSAPSVGFVDRLEDPRKHRHYHRNVAGLNSIDVYRVIDLFDVTDPCLQHITKKALCAGDRGHKDLRRDLEDIQDTAMRALEMLDEDEDLNDVR